MSDEIDRAAWPEFVYRLIEFYKWEPQHLKGAPDEFHRRIRRSEVSLNFLFNILLRSSGPDTLSTILRQFGLNESDLANEVFRVEEPVSYKFVQPDVRIESSNVRIFIELKVGATIGLEQVNKYLLLHAKMNNDRDKRPYLFFLTAEEFKNCWKPRAETFDWQPPRIP